MCLFVCAPVCLWHMFCLFVTCVCLFVCSMCLCVQENVLISLFVFLFLGVFSCLSHFVLPCVCSICLD